MNWTKQGSKKFFRISDKNKKGAQQRHFVRKCLCFCPQILRTKSINYNGKEGSLVQRELDFAAGERLRD